MGTFVPFRIIPGIRGCAFVLSDSEVEPNANERKMEDEERPGRVLGLRIVSYGVWTVIAAFPLTLGYYVTSYNSPLSQMSEWTNMNASCADGLNP